MEVIRGAPCGATWEAALSIIGLDIEEAPIKLGLVTQHFCTADPSGWDPINGKSPVHFAADIHCSAIVKAIREGNGL